MRYTVQTMHNSTKILLSLDLAHTQSKEAALALIRETLEQELGYHFSDVDESKPWGAYYRMVDEEADRFLGEFFTDMNPTEARLGNPDLILSPKILVVAPGQRLSWQHHAYRAERWHFLTAGGYHRSETNEQGELIEAKAGDVVQFETGERHRLVGMPGNYTLVAEVWQHTDPAHPSEEADIVRVADDYKR